MHTKKVIRGKQVYVADGKNEIIKLAILIALHIVQYQNKYYKNRNMK
jgi:hypothetical protein